MTNPRKAAVRIASLHWRAYHEHGVTGEDGSLDVDVPFGDEDGGTPYHDPRPCVSMRPRKADRVSPEDAVSAGSLGVRRAPVRRRSG